MKKKKIILIMIGLIILIGLSLFLGKRLFQYLRIKYAKIEVTLTQDLTLPFTESKKVSDFILSINGEILDDYVIDSTSLGEKDVAFTFKNDDGIVVSYRYQIKVVDNVPPVVWLNSSYSIQKGDTVPLTDKILCGDNEDSHPTCSVIGSYDVHTVGSYPLEFVATDRSGNTTKQNFTLYVKEPKKPSTSSSNTPRKRTLFSDIVATHKNEWTKIGLDVSKWQGEIDFEALKNAGVEFIFIRVGGTRGTGKEYFVDEYFKRNIEEANRYGIEVGIYFYSYANSNELAKQEALWVIEQIKDYKVSLPIAFDWENWNSFNQYHLSFFGLTDMATTFLNTVKEQGYDGLLYSSKNYLEKLWLPTEFDTWLAHYVNDFSKKSSYEGKYTFWQLCQDGKVNGIMGDVDIDIMYLN